MTIFDRFRRKPAAPAAQREDADSFFSTHRPPGGARVRVSDALALIRKNLPAAEPGSWAADSTVAMDDSQGAPFPKVSGATSFPESLAMWYVSQGFIGHQLCAIMAQNWLIDKACTMPGRDAIRMGYDIVSLDGDELPDMAVKMMNRYDRAMRLNWHLEEFIRKGRVFGIRIALFKVESTDPDYYTKPFNIDGVTPGSYKGIVQIDPYWTAPLTDGISVSQPDTLHFYEPTWWMINGRKYHRTHLVIYRHANPPDLLKPMYMFGGVPVPQQIMERVYAAERTANEAPQLAMTKRLNVWLTDMGKFMAKGDEAVAALNSWIYYRDNFGIKLGDKEGDEFQQFETSLADLDAVIMSQYQLVAAAAGVPVTKLLGTTPKGFNSTGEYEEASYHEELESIQHHDLSALIERHHALVIRSYIVAKVPQMANIETTVNWRPLDSPTAAEVAATNLQKAQTGAALIASGAIDSTDERTRIAKDPDSGYHQLGDREPEPQPDEGGEEGGGEGGEENNEEDGPAGDHAMDEQWITVHPNGKKNGEKGQPVLIDDGGTVIGGAGGKLDGQKFERAKGSGSKGGKSLPHHASSAHAHGLSKTAKTEQEHDEAAAAHTKALGEATEANDPERAASHEIGAGYHKAMRASLHAKRLEGEAKTGEELGNASTAHLIASRFAHRAGMADLEKEHLDAYENLRQRFKDQQVKEKKEAAAAKSKATREARKGKSIPEHHQVYATGTPEQIHDTLRQRFGLNFSNGNNAKAELTALEKERKGKYWDWTQEQREDWDRRRHEAGRKKYQGHGAFVRGHTEIDITAGNKSARDMRENIMRVDNAMQALVDAGFDIKGELDKYRVHLASGGVGKAMGHAWQDGKGNGYFGVSPGKFNDPAFLDEQARMAQARADAGKPRWTVSSGNRKDEGRSTVIHELAHALGMHPAKGSPQRLSVILTQLFPDFSARRQFLEKNVSQYATANIKEADAEIAAMVTSPEYVKGTLPKALEDHVDWLFNRKATQ